MKIVVIMASPRKGGNTNILVQEFIKGVESSQVDVEVINLYEKNISGCREIYACEYTGRCVIEDGGNAILDKLEQCDKLVIAMPIFFYGPPAQLKALIDRAQAMFMRKYILKNPIVATGEPKRSAYLIALGATKGKDLFEPSLLILQYFLDSLDFELKESFLYRSVENKGDILKHSAALQDVYELGTRIGDSQ